MVVTKKMKSYIIKTNSITQNSPQEITNKSKIKHCVYMNRMQKRIDRELEMGVWLTKNYPDIFRDENRNNKIHNNRRLRALMEMILAINPKMDLLLVLKNMPKESISTPIS
jgi:hypothetical protein